MILSQIGLRRAVWSLAATTSTKAAPFAHHHMVTFLGCYTQAQKRKPPLLKWLRVQRHFSSKPPYQRTDRSFGPKSKYFQGSPSPPGQDAVPTLWERMVKSAATSFASIVTLGTGFSLAAYAYHEGYKDFVLKKTAKAFESGDPIVELAVIGKNLSDTDKTERNDWIMRPTEQHIIDAIIAGQDIGHYHLFLGDKGTEKGNMLLEAIRNVDGEGVAVVETHSDLEIFRIRLGKALDYEFYEDYIGGYFSERGPRDTTALLDIERALNMLEKVALERRAQIGRPLVLIINKIHLIRDNQDGKNLIELLQQRAERWAAANLVTTVFISDDYWIYERLAQFATRMEVLAISDLSKAQATAALWSYRRKYFNEDLSPSLLENVYDRVGGRLSFLNRVAKSRDMLAACDKIIQAEKTWFLNQCWIFGGEMDDDVMDQQKWATAAVVLAAALADLEAEMDNRYDPEIGHVLPKFALHIAQQIMTRSDFIRDFDRLNIFSITSNAEVRASSVPMQRAFSEIVNQPGFREHLQATINRISAIESLGRTRELVAKDLVLGGKYGIKMNKNDMEVTLVMEEEDGR